MLSLVLSFAAASSAPSVYLLEAAGDQDCATAHNKQFGIGNFAGSFEAKEDGCYRLDAFAGSAECGFGGEQAVDAAWCLGKAVTVQHAQRPGWTSLGHWHLLAEWPAFRLAQAQGPVDAFRFVRVGSECTPETMNTGEFAALHLEADFAAVPADFLARAQELVNGWAQVHSLARGSVVLELELTQPDGPDAHQVAAAAAGACELLGAGPACAESATLLRPEAPAPRPQAPVVHQQKEKCSTCERQWYIVLGMVVGAPFLIVFGLFAADKLRRACAKGPKAALGWMSRPKTVIVRLGDLEAAEQKPAPADDDDNASTCTPNSLPSVADQELERGSVVSIPTTAGLERGSIAVA